MIQQAWSNSTRQVSLEIGGALRLRRRARHPPTLNPVPHPNSRAAKAARRRTRRMALVEHDLSPEQWAMLQELWGGCAYCGAGDRALQRDCVQPISRGGRYTLDNIVPACGPCNASKSNDEVTSWMRRKKLDERRFLVRFVGVQDALASGDGLT